MRRFIAVALLVLTLPLASAQAGLQQMGSGDPYVDAQIGLTYAIWKPTTTANLKLSEIKLLICTMKSEEWISATYGSKKKYLKIMESDSQARCSDPGVGKQVSNIKVGAAKARVFAFCNQADHVAWSKCSADDIVKVGGYVMWVAPKTKLLKSTIIEVIGMGLSYKDIILTARGLKAISR